MITFVSFFISALWHPLSIGKITKYWSLTTVKDVVMNILNHKNISIHVILIILICIILNYKIIFILLVKKWWAIIGHHQYSLKYQLTHKKLVVHHNYNSLSEYSWNWWSIVFTIEYIYTITYQLIDLLADLHIIISYVDYHHA